MEYLVIAEVEIDGAKVEHYTNIALRQKFNSHHEFIIRINHDVLETSGTFSLESGQKKIGKSCIIRLQQLSPSPEIAYEFRGIICEVRVESSGNTDADLVLLGYSPTIVTDTGQHLVSFYKADLKKIVQQVTKPLGQVNCNINIRPQYTKQLTYICQYKESGFHFLNRLSAEFSEFFYYDGRDVNFGKPSSSKTTEVTYGEDVHSIQLTLKALPVNFTGYSYSSKQDKLEKYDAPSGVSGLGQYASYVLKESNSLFTDKVSMPVRQRVESKADLENFVKKRKASLAANLEVLTGSSYNPKICIGGVIDVKISRLKDQSFVKDDYGKFLIISIEHLVNENGKYYNTFEAIPANSEVIPVTDITMPVAEPQVATVMDNKDPDNMGRIRVQMLWQQAGNQMTDWLRVLTSDAGKSDIVSKNRGFAFIPEVGDQVLVCFRYNDADRPFVLGSIFHGKTAAGGGPDNNKKTLSTRSGNIIELNDKKGEEKITVNTNSGHRIELDDKKGAEKITIVDKNKNTIVIDTVADSINITANDSINLDAPSINLTATSISMLAKAAITMNAGGAIEGAAGAALTFGAGASASFMSALDTTILAGKMFSASGGKNVKISSGAGARIDLEAKGNAKFNSSKKMDISSKESNISGTDKALLTSKNATVEGSSKAVVKGSAVDIS